jgi:nicotinate-nucleotide pyrophosphorylase (carboxylating)
MSGVASATHRLVSLIPSNSRTKLLDTRKTAPGLRVLDKQAVLAGGGLNHRYALYDMVLIKDNHVDAAGGVEQAVANVRKYLQERNQLDKIQIEVPFFFFFFFLVSVM